MKILLHFLFFTISFVAYGQSTVQVRYLQKKNARINEDGGEFFSNDEFAIMVSNGTQTTYRYGQGGNGKEVEKGENNSVKITYSDAYGYVFHRDRSAKTFIFRDLIKDQPFVVKDEYPEFDWNISLDISREIGGYQCNKAVTTFRGRTYEAWFTMEVPVDAGPWKLNGLPGLILEANDSEGVIKFIFAGIELVKEEDVDWNKPPSNGIKTSFKDFFATRSRNYDEFIKKISSYPGVTVTPFKSTEYFETNLD